MVDSGEISRHVEEVRSSLGYVRGVEPRIMRVVQLENRIECIVSDRAEKSLLLGPGGRIIAEVAQRIGQKITVVGQDERIIQDYRRGLTLERIDEIWPDLSPEQSEVISRLKSTITSGTQGSRSQKGTSNARVAVAFSGGSDSTAALLIVRGWQMQITAVTADPGIGFLLPKEKARITDTCRELALNHLFLDVSEATREVRASADSGRKHPCGSCHLTIMESVKKHAKVEGFHALVTGELLPSGRQSIEMDGDLLVIHLPASLAMTKYATQEISRDAGTVGDDSSFGCDFLSGLHSKGWRFSGPSIFRVLRELQAGVLTTGQALRMIKTILKGTQATWNLTTDCEDEGV
jgi:predicted PP-loop superfamily ATPase